VKHYEVKYLVSDRRDILELMRFLAEKESPDRARSVLRQICERCDDLETMPRRGHMPPELAELDVGKFLELHFKPYRMIYQISDHTVYIHLICDGRRDMQSLLRTRLLSPEG